MAREDDEPRVEDSGAARPSARQVRCKTYHRPHGSRDAGLERTKGDHKSRCPGWLSDALLRQRLLSEALEDPEGGTDMKGRPKRLWNAVAGWTFVGVSSNEPVPAYNCYPEVPLTVLAEELAIRAERGLEDLRGDEEQRS